MQVVNVDGILGNVVAPIVGLAVGDAAFYAAAGKPDGKAAGMVVASVGFGVAALAVDGPAEFTAPNDEGVFKEAAFF